MAGNSEQSEKWIEAYVSLQRIKAAQDPEKEISYQEAVVKAHLQSLGISTENLDIK